MTNCNPVSRFTILFFCILKLLNQFWLIIQLIIPRGVPNISKTLAKADYQLVVLAIGHWHIGFHHLELFCCAQNTRIGSMSSCS